VPISLVTDQRASCRRKLPIKIAICTVHDAASDSPRSLRTALAMFNEVILREAVLVHIPVIDLRVICDAPED